MIIDNNTYIISDVFQKVKGQSWRIYWVKFLKSSML